jgi:cyclophilin family peptidyl-prolyl cis-trans isomerase
MAAGYRHGWLAALAGVAAVGLLATGCGGTSNASGSTSSSASTPTASPMPTTGTVQCDFTATPDQPAPAGHSFGVPPAGAPRAGTSVVTLHTTQGDIAVTMPRGKAPCTVASFAFLAGKGFFNNSPCHRLTAADTLKVLQCGDPTGTGTGGPGYTIPDENPTDLANSGVGASVYPRGTIAMANTGAPHTGGCQFFLVYADSMLPPQYAVFGTIDAASLAVVDKVAKAGVTAGGDPTDGKPAMAISITSTSVSGN